MTEFRMPSLGADMEAGTLVEWLAKPGDRLERGDVIAVVETQKGAIEVEIFESGILEKYLVEPGAVVPVGTALAVIRGDSEAAKAPATAPTPPEPAPREPAREPAGSAPPPRPAAADGHPRASPVARRRAAALGVDLSTVRGRGAGGAITLADVEAAAGAASGTSKARATAKPAAMSAAIAAAMGRSKREIPHYYLAQSVNFEAAARWLETYNASRPVAERLIYGVLLVKAVALALRRFTEFNGFWRDDAHVTSDAIHVGVAIAIRGGGLLAPALKAADQKDLATLMDEFRDLVRRARTGGLRSSEMADATITLTSLGEEGVEVVFPVIYPPQVAIVGFGAVNVQPSFIDGEIVPVRWIRVSLAGDHRVSNGHRGAQFLRAIQRNLEEPDSL